MKDAVGILKRLALMMRQFGNLSGSLLFLIRGVDGWATQVEEMAYTNMVKTELADVIYQDFMLSVDLDLDYNELWSLGQKRYHETRAKFEKEGRLKEWV